MTLEERMGAFTVQGISFPIEIAGFTRGEIIDNEVRTKGLGTTIAYGQPPFGKATIFVYDKGLRDISDGPDGQVREEFDIATQDVFSRAQIPGGPAIELVSRYGTGTPLTRREFLCAEFVQHSPNGQMRSFLYVTGAKVNFVKIRVTLATDDPRDPSARNFANAVAKVLWNA